MSLVCSSLSLISVPFFFTVLLNFYYSLQTNHLQLQLSEQSHQLNTSHLSTLSFNIDVGKVSSSSSGQLETCCCIITKLQITLPKKRKHGSEVKLHRMISPVTSMYLIQVGHEFYLSGILPVFDSIWYLKNFPGQV